METGKLSMRNIRKIPWISIVNNHPIPLQETMLPSISSVSDCHGNEGKA